MMTAKNPENRRQYAIQIKDIIPAIAKNIDNGKQYINLCLNWQAIVGAEFAEHLTPVKIQSQQNKKTLMLKCTNGAEITMSYAQNEIINRINLYFGRKKISHIKLLPENKKISTQNAVKKITAEGNEAKIQSLKNLANRL